MSDRLFQLLSVHRYPSFFTDLVVARLAFGFYCLCYGFSIGKSATVRGLPILSLARQSSIHIGDHAYLISRSRNTALGVNHPVILRTLRPQARINIASRFRASGVTLCAAKGIVIGDRVTMGANVVVTDTDFHAAEPGVRSSGEDASCAKCAEVTIEDDVFVGMNAMILKGVAVGRGAIIGAGSVVTRYVPPRAIVAGNPAQVLSQSVPV
jgi:acetyltransferase-like isoleucine patch superfamily enzyme